MTLRGGSVTELVSPAVRLEWPSRRAAVLFLSLLCAVWWAIFTRGAFYRLELMVFSGLAVASGIIAMVVWRSGAAAIWWLVTVSVALVSVVGSAAASGTVSDVGYGLAPLVAAVSLATVGSGTRHPGDRLRVLEVVANAMALLAATCWVGVVFHLPGWAVLQNAGWRASGPLGYPNAAAVLLLIGLVCSCCLQLRTCRSVDSARSWLLAISLFATQSRVVFVAAALCLMMLWAMRRPMSRALLASLLGGLVGFGFLVPSVVGLDKRFAVACAAIGSALCIIQVMYRGRRAAWCVVLDGTGRQSSR